LLLGFQAVEQATGLISQLLLASTYGASARTDAYVLAITVVGVFVTWTQLPLQQVLIPMFRHDLAQRGDDIAWRNASVLLNNLLVVFVIVTVAGWAASPVLVGVAGGGFDDATATLASSLTRVTMITVLFAGLAEFLSQLLLSYRRFVLVGVAGTLNNLVFSAALVLLGSRWGIEAAGVGLVAAYGVETLIQLPVLWQHRRRYRLSVNFSDPGFRELLRLSWPLFVTAGGLQLQRITDRLFASFLVPGSLSALAFAGLLIDAPRALLLQPFQKTLIPHFTELIALGRLEALSRRLFQYIRFLLFITVPAAAGVIVLSDLIVRAVFQRGVFDASAVDLTSTALCFYAIGVPATFIGKVLNMTYMSLKDTRTPMRATYLQIATKIGLACALIPSMALAGIALADSIGSMVRAGCLLRLLPREVRAAQIRPTFSCILHSAASAAAMVVLVYLLKSAGDGYADVTLRVVALASTGAATYLLLSALSRQAELQWLGRGLATIWQR
jgi:putative peptidoglycan lipid II flippase